MKRNATILIAIAIVAIALCACNIDATDGIYSEVASSTESKDVVMISYLGTYGDEHYYLADDGVYRNGSSSPLIANSSSKIIRNASLDESTGNILILLQDRSTLKAQIHECTAADDYAIGSPINDSNYTGLLVNGVFFNESGIYYSPSATSVVPDVKVQYYLETEEYAFFSVKDSSNAYKHYVIKDGSAIISDVEGSSTTYVGFQPLSDSTYVLISYDSSKSVFNGYQFTSAGVGDKWFQLSSSIPYAYASQAASFCFTNDSKTYMAIKCRNYFDIIDVTDTAATGISVKPLSTGFATDIRTTEVTNVKKTATDNVFIAGTYDSLLYQIDMSASEIENSSAKQL